MNGSVMKRAAIFAIAFGIGALLLMNVQGYVASDAAPQFPPYRYLIALFCAAVAYVAWRMWREPAAASVPRSAQLWIVIAVAAAGFAFIEWYLWHFDLDDKWVYYRMSRNVLTTGLPLWNANEMALVGASFIYPYLVSIPNLFGDWPVWDLYQKVIGMGFTLAICGLILWKFRFDAAAALAVAAVLLYEPLAQWSIGGMETSFATLWVVFSAVLYLTSSGRSRWPWLLLGALIYIRPDAILIGVGLFVARYLRDPAARRDWLVNGFLFAVPIVAFLVQNQILFGFPLPLVVLVKGWNCAYCGHDPIYYKMYVGLIHNLSGIFVSFLIGLLSLGGIWRVVRGARIRFSRSAPIVTDQPVAFDLYVGLAAFMLYHIIGGYQHMNFTFRYWVPGIVGMLVVSLHVVQTSGAGSDQNQPKGFLDRISPVRWTAPLVFAALFVQLAQSALTTYHARHFDITLTAAPQRDHFSVDSYAAYLKDWFKAGLDLRAAGVKSTDSLYLMQGMLTGAISDGYLVDQFYFPPRWTSREDLKRCRSLPEAPHACDIFYDYLITFPDKKYWPDTHFPVNSYNTIAVLKRKNYPTPETPINVAMKQVSFDTFSVRWNTSGPGETRFDLEVSASSGGASRIEWAQPGLKEIHIKSSTDVAPAVRIRACNDKGCSSWSSTAVEDKAG